VEKKKLWVTGELKPLPESLETVINMIQHGLWYEFQKRYLMVILLAVMYTFWFYY